MPQKSSEQDKFKLKKDFLKPLLSIALHRAKAFTDITYNINM
ncbi:hypothetical protein MNV_50070 [Candidatus Methanoperedens nitroreducens]|uniref:Uncharacterized protein n=1 Tax=Candidatus Methanoperedens nitratireducens TaxID=1392998 RepID=A0A284VRA0_9EURY|nr:hypothetical protein MNV_50070 [Candidatus Methanoperedens nitroreducens]